MRPFAQLIFLKMTLDQVFYSLTFSFLFFSRLIQDGDFLSLSFLSLNLITGAKSLAKMLKYNSTISHLDLSHNPLGIDGNYNICEAMKVNSSLKFLDLSHNIVDQTARFMTAILIWQGAGIISDAILVNKSIQNLRLRGNWIGDLGVKKISEYLKLNSTLESLDLGLCIVFLFKFICCLGRR